MPEPTAAIASGEVSIDVEQARAAVRKLEEVREELYDVRREALEVARYSVGNEAGRDAVSVEAFQLLAAKADGGPGSLVDALTGAVAHVSDLIDQMNVDITAQEEIDGRAATGMQSL